MAINDKISCICITQNRADLLKKAIKHYENQTYSNKELIILYPEFDYPTEELAKSNATYNQLLLNEENGEWTYDTAVNGGSAISFVKLKSFNQHSLGTKRNLATTCASGDYICVWDDDDYYANERLDRQFDFLKFTNKDAVALAQLTLYFQNTGKAYVSNARDEGWEGSLLCKKDAIGSYSDLERGEDTPVMHRLYKQEKLAIMEDPRLYVYNIHYANTSTPTHFMKLEKNSIELDVNNTKVVQEQLEMPTVKTKTFDAVLSLGAWCQVGSAARVRSLHLINSPFHNFGIKVWQNVIQILEDRFANYWELENMAIGKPEENYSARYEEQRMIYKAYCNKYNMLCNHHFDVQDNKPDELLTYDSFKEKIDVLGDVFLEQCKEYETVLFCMKVMSAPVETEINRGDIKRLCNVLDEVRYGKYYELRISVPAALYDEVCQWVKEDGLHHVKVFAWTVDFNDEYFSEEWENMYGGVELAPDYLFRLNRDIFQIDDPTSQHIAYLNS